MKLKLFIILIFASLIFALTISVGNEPVTVETGIKAMNRITYRALLDSTAYNSWQHKKKTTTHDKADNTTKYLLPNDSVYGSDDNLQAAIIFALAERAYLAAHFANDSAHCGSADVTTVLPKAISIHDDYTKFNNFTDSLMLAQNTHFGRVKSTRYNYLMKIFVARYIAHCARDTSDASDVHFDPDITYNTLTFDSTNVDSTRAGMARAASRWNLHIRNLTAHNVTGIIDSIRRAIDLTPDTYAEMYILANELVTRSTLHYGRDTTAVTGHDPLLAIHKKADPNIVTTAAVSSGGGHIAADANTYIDNAYVNWQIPSNDRFTLQYTPAANDTANFYYYGSVLGQTYAYIDSVAIIGVAGVPQLKHLNTNYYPYFRVMMNAKKTLSGRNTGAWRIDFRGEK